MYKPLAKFEQQILKDVKQWVRIILKYLLLKHSVYQYRKTFYLGILS